MPERGINKTADAIVVCIAPDVCKTPVGSAVVPIPYPIISKFDTSKGTSKNTNFEGQPVFHFDSHLPNVTGDEAGTAGGIISGVNRGICNPVEHSSTVRINGQWSIRHGDLMDMNLSLIHISEPTRPY